MAINWKNKTILIVEDDFTSKELLEEILLDTKAKVVHASDGVEAVDICKNNQDIDIVLMDLLLPYKDGYQATQEIKKIRSKLPIIAQTAFAMTSDKMKSYAAGCNDFIAKPIKSEELLRKMTPLLNNND